MVIIAKDQVREPLWAIVPYFNPWRWKSRVKHTERAIKHFHDSGAVIILVEIGLTRRELVFADSGLMGTAPNCRVLGDHPFRHQYIGLHTKDELWLKENAINIGAQRIPYQYFDQLCWLDADIEFVRYNWVGETIHKLQHGTTSEKAFLQMFSQARDIGPNYELLDENYPHASGLGFVHAWQKGLLQTTLTPEIQADLKELSKDAAKFGHNPEQWLKGRDQVVSDLDMLQGDTPTYYQGRVFPGLAWAATRPAWEAVGGLFDTAIWGGGDWHMSHALIEKTEGMMRHDLHRNYKKKVMQWYHRCRTEIRRNVLVMEGVVLHNWHGKKTGRGYNTKHALLAKFGFDPERHLKRDHQGLWQLHDDRSTSYVQLRDLLRVIAKERNEDSPEI